VIVTASSLVGRSNTLATAGIGLAARSLVPWDENLGRISRGAAQPSADNPPIARPPVHSTAGRETPMASR
jgi:hypothetical protein